MLKSGDQAPDFGRQKACEFRRRSPKQEAVARRREVVNHGDLGCPRRGELVATEV